MSLRRPSMLRSSPELRNCINIIDPLTEISELDNILVANAKLFQIVENISNDLSYSDPERDFDISNDEVAGKVAQFRHMLLEWRDNAGLASRHGNFLRSIKGTVSQLIICRRCISFTLSLYSSIFSRGCTLLRTSASRFCGSLPAE